MKNKSTIEYYKQLYQTYGNKPEALGCTKGKQYLRFYQLTSEFDLNNKSFLDFGCGFGYFAEYLNKMNVDNYSYTGIDIMPEFISEAIKNFNNYNVKFLVSDLDKFSLNNRFDYVIASGIFNSKLENNYEFIWNSMQKMFELANEAICLDFLSDKVDFSYESNFNSAPEKILSMAYMLSKRVILKNNFFPFEYSIIIFKDDSFSKETTTFNDYVHLLEK